MFKAAKGEHFAIAFEELVKALDGVGMKDKMLPKITNNITAKVNEGNVQNISYIK